MGGDPYADIAEPVQDSAQGDPYAGLAQPVIAHDIVAKNGKTYRVLLNSEDQRAQLEQAINAGIDAGDPNLEKTPLPFNASVHHPKAPASPPEDPVPFIDPNTGQPGQSMGHVDAPDPTLVDYAKQMGSNFVDDLASFGKGVGSLIDIPTRALGWTMGKIGSAVGAPESVTAPLSDPFTIRKGIEAAVPPQQNPSRPQQYAEAASEALGATATNLGVGRALSAFGGPVSQRVGAALQSHPLTQSAAALTGSAGGETARQAGYGPTGQIVASLAGAFVPGAIGVRVAPVSENALASIPANAEIPTAAKGPLASIARLTGRDQTAGARLVSQRLADDGINPRDAGRVMTEAQANGTPLALADLGENTRALAGSVTRQPGPARTIGKEFTKERQMGQLDRVRDAINRDIGPTTDIHQESANLVQQAQQQAAPLYEKALAGGSVAPLETQFKNAFQQSSTELAAARRAVADAQTRVTQGAADLSRGEGNVYGASAGLRAGRQAKAALDEAQARLSESQGAHEANIQRLRQAQADGSANAPGAVWSPRIQQFLDDPITKAGLAKGLEVQRLEALASGKRFNPSEYAITGTDGAGNPIVASVPNMRTLDAVKRGFDELLNAYPRSISGKLMLDGRGRAIDMARKSFINELDRINPTYADARAAYAGPMELRDAMEDGKRALNKSASEINQRIKNMTPAEAEQYGLGLRSAMADAMAGSPDGANKVRALVGNPKRREVLNLVFGNRGNLDRFVSTLENEHAAFETYQAIHGGPATAGRVGEDQANSDVGLLRGLGSDLAAVGGGPTGVTLRVLERGGDLLRFGAGKAGQRTREDAASLLFSTSPAEFENALGKITLQGRRELYRRNAFAPLAAASGAAAFSKPRN